MRAIAGTHFSFFGLFVSEPMLDIALMAAILPVAVSIGSKRLPAVQADEIVVGFSIHYVHMRLPTMIATGVTTELFSFALWLLFNFRATVFCK